jgi:hypothetical protein
MIPSSRAIRLVEFWTPAFNFPRHIPFPCSQHRPPHHRLFCPSSSISLIAVHPCSCKIDTFPFAVKTLPLSHPESIGRTTLDRPHCPGRRPIPQEPVVTRCTHQTLPLADRTTVWTSLLFGRTFCWIRNGSGSLCTFYYPFRFGLDTLHFSPSPFDLDLFLRLRRALFRPAVATPNNAHLVSHV